MDPESKLSLGLSLGPKMGAAVLISPTRVVAAAVESRARRLPLQAIQYCLREAGLNSLSQISVLALQSRHAAHWLDFLADQFGEQRSWLESLVTFPGEWRKEMAFRNRIQKELQTISPQSSDLLLVDDDQALARGIYVSRQCENAVILNLDLPLQKQATGLWRGNENGLEAIWSREFPQSLELLTANLAGFSGFRGRMGQRQFLQLAEYGEPRFVEKIKENLFAFEDTGSYQLSMSRLALDPAVEAKWQDLDELFSGPARQSTQPIGSREIDLAHSWLQVAGDWALRLIDVAKNELGVPRLTVRGQGALFDRLKIVWKTQPFPVNFIGTQNDSLLRATGAAIEGLSESDVQIPIAKMFEMPKAATMDVSAPLPSVPEISP